MTTGPTAPVDLERKRKLELLKAKLLARRKRYAASYFWRWHFRPGGMLDQIDEKIDQIDAILRPDLHPPPKP